MVQPNIGHRMARAVVISHRQLAPRLGRMSKEWLRLSHKQHVIFYRSDANGIEIVRILHSARDTDRHF